MTLTLNNLVAKLEEFVTNHEILNNWYFNDPYDGLKDGETIVYPMMFGVLEPSRLALNADFTTFEIYICDKVNKDKTNETKVSSDTKQLAKDLLSYLKQTVWSEFLQIKTDVTLEHFYESFGDEVTGCKFKIEIKTAFEWDICSVPIVGAPTQPNLTMTASLENYTVSGTSQAILHTPITNAVYLFFLNGQYMVEGVRYIRSGTTVTFYEDYTQSTTPLDVTGSLFTASYYY